VFVDIMNLNERSSKKWIDSTNMFVMEQVQLITEYHLVWAELLSKLGDYDNKLKGTTEKEKLILDIDDKKD